MISSSAFTRSDIETRVCRAIEKLREHDMYLLTRDANERSITHHLAVYIQQEYPGWDVDVEYNRDGYDVKRLPLDQLNISSDETNATTVYPDIIVHRRGDNNDNFLVIEAKKSDGECELDEKKLVEFTKSLKDDGLGYRWGLHLILRSNEQGKASLRWYEQGKPCEE